MRLIENSEEGIPRFSPEAKMIEPFRSIIDRDKSKGKDLALRQLAFIHFWCVFDSRYDMYDNTLQKEKRIKDDLGIEDKWNFTSDSLVMQGVNKYKDLTVTRSSRLVEKSDKTLKKLEDFFDNLILDGEENKNNSGSMIVKPKEVQDFILSLPDTIKAVQESEKLVRKELEEQSGKKLREDLGMFEQRKIILEKDRPVM